jgi:hypothetical protein
VIVQAYTIVDNALSAPCISPLCAVLQARVTRDLTAQAIVQESGSQTKVGYAQPAESSAMSRRRLSFFAQLQRPKQVPQGCVCAVSFILGDMSEELTIGTLAQGHIEASCNCHGNLCSAYTGTTPSYQQQEEERGL